MKKSNIFIVVVIFILIAVSVIAILWKPEVDEPSGNSSVSILESSRGNSSVSVGESEASSSVSESEAFESSLTESSPVSSSSDVSQPNNDLVPEDQPDDPDLNFEISEGASFDDIMVNVLTCLLSQNMADLSAYVGDGGLRLCPTGSAAKDDVVLSADQVASFFSLGSQSYGIYPGSGATIECTPNEYYSTYLYPSGFDFSASSVAFNDAADLEAAAGVSAGAKTVSYYYAPNVMEWKRIIFVYESGHNGDVLCGILYQDLTTN